MYRKCGLIVIYSISPANVTFLVGNVWYAEDTTLRVELFASESESLILFQQLSPN